MQTRRNVSIAAVEGLIVVPIFGRKMILQPTLRQAAARLYHPPHSLPTETVMFKMAMTRVPYAVSEEGGVCLPWTVKSARWM